MRFPTAFAALWLVLLPVVAGSQAVPPSPPAAPGPVSMTPAPPGDPAARHAKRTACLKEARSKKLVGSQRTAFVKDCMGGG